MTTEELQQAIADVQHDLAQVERLQEKVVRDFSKWKLVRLELTEEGFRFRADLHQAFYKDKSLFAFHLQNAVQNAKTRYQELGQDEDLGKVIAFENAFAANYDSLKKVMLRDDDGQTTLFAPTAGLQQSFDDTSLIFFMLHQAVESAKQKLTENLNDLQTQLNAQ